MDQPIDHVGGGRPMQAMAQVEVGEQGGHGVGIRADPSGAGVAFMRRVIFTHVQHFNAISNGEEV